MLGFFSNTKTKNIGQNHRCADDVFIIGNLRITGEQGKSVLMDGKADLVNECGICFATTQRHFNQTAF